MDPLLQITDAIVADLETVKGGDLGLVFVVERNEIPEWETSKHKAEENTKARVYAAATASEGDHDSRASYQNTATVQLAVGAWTAVNRDHRDQLSSLAHAIADRYRQKANRTLTIAGLGEVTITNAVRSIVYDAELLRTEGAWMGNVNLTVEFVSPTTVEA